MGAIGEEVRAEECYLYKQIKFGRNIPICKEEVGCT